MATRMVVTAMSRHALYKTISQELLNLLEIDYSKSYYFYSGGEKITLEETKIDPLNSSDQSYSVMDKNRRWASKRNETSMFLNFHLAIKNVVHLFWGENRVINSKAKLGVALIWQIGNSKVIHSAKVGELTDYDDEIIVDRNDIEIADPDANIDFSLVIYVIEPGKDESSDGFASKRGMVLYNKKLWSIVVFGNASIFPVFEYSKPGDPLWRIEANFDDWATCKFDEESVNIFINKAHPLYEAFNDEEQTDLHSEIVTSAMACLVSQIMQIAKENEQLSDLDNGNIEAEGSILGVIKYLRDALSVNIMGLPQDIFYSLKMSKGAAKNVK